MIENNDFINQLILIFTSKLRERDWGRVKGKYSHLKERERERERSKLKEILHFKVIPNYGLLFI